jgi:hypothetical protein
MADAGDDRAQGRAALRQAPTSPPPQKSGERNVSA